jgi:hypothetical protein
MTEAPSSGSPALLKNALLGGLLVVAGIALRVIADDHRPAYAHSLGGGIISGYTGPYPVGVGLRPGLTSLRSQAGH